MYRVLQVDDEALFLEGLRTLIDWEELGLDAPDSALGGEAALEMLAGTQYDILITDIRMPGMSGLDLIEQVRGRDDAIKILIISGHDDFHYLKTAFQYGIENYLLKPIDADELTQTLQYTVDKIDSERERIHMRQMMDTIALDNVLNSWIDGSMTSDKLTERLELMQIRLDRKQHAACVVRTAHPERAENRAAAAQGTRAIQATFRQVFSEDEDAYITFNLNGDLVLILARDTPSDDRELARKLKLAVTKWLGDERDWHAVIGRWESDPMRLSGSYREAVEKLIYSTLLPRERIQIGAALHRRIGEMEARLGFSRERLKALHDLGDDALLAELEALSHALTVGGETAHTFADLLAIVFGQAARRKKGPSAADYDAVMAADSPAKRSDALCGLILEYHRASPARDEMHPLVARVLKGIAEHYDTELSLKTLAAEYNVSQSYLGRIFKKDTDALFTQYLNDYRIERAKELLLTTQLKSAEIAEKTGFSNPNYFANVFKKSVGVYPTLFRRKKE